MLWLDDRLHRVKCRLHKAGRRRLFRVVYRLSLPLCRMVEAR